MINEFHSALINAGFDSGLLGSDYVDPQWRTVEMSQSAKAVQRSLLISPESSTASNWRAYEIRRLIPKTDLASYLTRFDARTGYELSQLIRELSEKFTPLVTNNANGRIQLRGKLLLPAYRYLSWHLQSDGSQWTLQSIDNPSAVYTGDYTYRASSLPFVSHLRPLPGWNAVGDETNVYAAPDEAQRLDQAVVYFPAVTLDSNIFWAAKPSINLAHTAEELSTTVRAAVTDLADEQISRLPQHDRYFLRDVVFGAAEPVAKVCAAALLLVGRNLRDSTSH